MALVEADVAPEADVALVEADVAQQGDKVEKPRDRIKEALSKTPEGQKKVACKECDGCKKKKACIQPKFVAKPAKKVKSASSGDPAPVALENSVEKPPAEDKEARVGLKLD